MERNTTEAGKLLVGLSYDYEYLSKAMVEDREWVNINNERTKITTYSIYLNYGLTEQFSLEAIIPFRLVTNEKILFHGQYSYQPEGGNYVRDADGFGDVVIMGRYFLPELINEIQMAVGLGLKLATGDTEAEDIYSQRFSDNLQIGSGTLDPVFSVFLARPSNNWLTNANALIRLSFQENIYGYKYGNEYHLSAGVNYNSTNMFFLKNRLNFIYTQRDTYQYGDPAQSRGGKSVYYTPGIGIRAPNGMVVNFEYPIAIYQKVNEAQLMSEGFLSLNLTFTF